MEDMKADVDLRTSDINLARIAAPFRLSAIFQIAPHSSLLFTLILLYIHSIQNLLYICTYGVLDAALFIVQWVLFMEQFLSMQLLLYHYYLWVLNLSASSYIRRT